MEQTYWQAMMAVECITDGRRVTLQRRRPAVRASVVPTATLHHRYHPSTNYTYYHRMAASTQQNTRRCNSFSRPPLQAPRSATFPTIIVIVIFQRLSVLIHRYNAILLHDCFVKEEEE